MAKKKADKQEEPQEPQPTEPRRYEVKAAQNLGPSITGGPFLAAGQGGTVTLEPARYERLKKAGYFAE